MINGFNPFGWVKPALFHLITHLPYLLLLALIVYYLRDIAHFLGSIWYIFYMMSGGTLG